MTPSEERNQGNVQVNETRYTHHSSKLTLEPVRECCREWVESKSNICGEEAVVLVWGKLHEPEEFGPKCIDHLPEGLRRHPFGLRNYAALDLRNLYRMESDQ